MTKSTIKRKTEKELIEMIYGKDDLATSSRKLFVITCKEFAEDIQIERFLWVASRVVEKFEVFDFTRFAFVARNLELDYKLLKRLFDVWIKIMVKNKLIEEDKDSIPEELRRATGAIPIYRSSAQLQLLNK